MIDWMLAFDWILALVSVYWLVSHILLLGTNVSALVAVFWPLALLHRIAQYGLKLEEELTRQVPELPTAKALAYKPIALTKQACRPIKNQLECLLVYIHGGRLYVIKATPIRDIWRSPR